MLYKHQKGIGGDNEFDRNRGVRQRDILSPILFNAAPEHVLGRWKDGLLFERFALHGNRNTERLTYLRYVDDPFLFGHSLDETISMFDSPTEIVRVYGLELNMTKTRSLSTERTTEDTQICITKYGSVEIVGSRSLEVWKSGNRSNLKARSYTGRGNKVKQTCNVSLRMDALTCKIRSHWIHASSIHMDLLNNAMETRFKN